MPTRGGAPQTLNLDTRLAGTRGSQVNMPPSQKRAVLTNGGAGSKGRQSKWPENKY